MTPVTVSGWSLSWGEVSSEPTSIREPRTQIHSGISVISPYWEETQEKEISIHQCAASFRSCSHKRLHMRNNRDLLSAHLQCVRPVAGGPIRDPQGRHGVAGVHLRLRYKPARPRWRRRWEWLPLTRGDLVTRTHTRYVTHQWCHDLYDNKNTYFGRQWSFICGFSRRPHWLVVT